MFLVFWDDRYAVIHIPFP